MLAALLAVVLTVAVTRWLQSHYEESFAVRMARTTAAYVGAVTPAPAPPPIPPVRRGRRVPAPAPPPPPPPRITRGFDIPQLLTQARALRTLPGWTSDVEVYYGTAPLIDAAAPPLDSGSVHGALVPLLDHERRLVGAVEIRPHRLPRGPLPGGMGFVFPAGLVVVAAALAIALGQRPLRRGGYALAALLLAVAAYADVRAAARQSTDRWLVDTRRLLQEAATRLPPPRARAAITDLVALVGDAELVAGEPGESAPQRARIDGQRRAVAAVLIGPGRWVELRTIPAEDATIGWGLLLLTCAFAGPAAIWTIRWAERTPRRLRRETAIAWGFLAPAGVHIAAFFVGPLLLLLYLALHSHEAFVGLTNVRSVLRDPDTWLAVRSTAIYALYVPVATALALVFALMLHDRGGRPQATWPERLARGALFAPAAGSIVASAMLWQLGLMRTDAWRAPGAALIAIMALSIWVAVGAQLLVFLVALQGIPRAYGDAARVDGAGAWRRFWRITFPLLRPVIGFVFVTGIVNALQLFTIVEMLRPNGVESPAHRVYALALASGSGPASALALLFFVALIPLTVLQIGSLRRRIGEA
jgi:multiple sugar transport system permease protein